MKPPVDRLNNHVKEHGMKTSTQRNLVLEIMLRDKKHLTVEELYETVKAENPDIGIATVYRTVRLLCDANIARELPITQQVSRYEIISERDHHDHLICTSCGRFVEISSDQIEQEQIRIAKKHEFTLTDHSLVLYGICKDCRKKEKGTTV